MPDTTNGNIDTEKPDSASGEQSAAIGAIAGNDAGIESRSAIDERSDTNLVGRNKRTKKGTESGESELPKQRVRKPREKRVSATQAKSKILIDDAAVSAFAKKIAGIHSLIDVMLQKSIGVKGMMTLEDDESEQLAKAIAEIANQYDLTPDPKVMSWVNLAAVMATIYTPKYLLIKMTFALRKVAADAQQNAT